MGCTRKRSLEFLGPVRKSRPTSTVPGSADRIEVLRARVEARQELFSASDSTEDGEGLAIRCGRNGKPLVVGVEREIAEKQLRLTVVKLRSFSEKLIFLRRRRGFLMVHVARRAGLTIAGVYHLEVGARQPTFATAIALARALEVPVSILAGELVG